MNKTHDSLLSLINPNLKDGQERSIPLRKIISIAAMSLLGVTVNAQTNISSYNFTKSIGNTYTPITGGTVFLAAGTSYDSNVSTAITLSTPFPYGGTTVNTVFISSNGYITFGAAPGSSSYTPLSTTVTNQTGVISAFGQDGANSTVTGAQSEIRYEDLGSEFVVQYQDHANYYNRSVEKLNFQIRLNYTTGEINIIYGNCTSPGSSTSSSTPQVGIRGNSTTFETNVNNLYLPNYPVATNCDWSKAVGGFSNSSSMVFSSGTNSNITIPAGLKFTWSPNTQAPVRTFAAVSNITATGADLSWTAPTDATSYNLQYRQVGECDWTNYSSNPINTNTVMMTGLNQGTDYQVRLQALNGNSQSMYSHIPGQAASSDGTISKTFKTLYNCGTVPTALTSTAITLNSATIGWTAPTTAPAFGYEYYISTTNVAPSASTQPTGTVAAGTTSVNLTNLNSSTNYYFWVRSNCDNVNKGEWSVMGSFTTVCGVLTIPYTQNFDTTSTGSSTNVNAPVCWSYLEPSGSAAYGYVYATNPSSAPNCYYLFNSSDNSGNIMLVSPRTANLSDGTRQVTFKVKGGGSNYLLNVGTMSSNTDNSTFTNISTITIPSSSAYTTFTVTIPAGSDEFLAFKHGLGGTSRSIYLDDISVENAPTCMPPISLAGVSSTHQSITLNWAAPLITSPQSYELYYSTTNTAPTATTVPQITGVTGLSTVVTGLNPLTTYYFWMRSSCSASDKSAWTATALDYATSCLPSATPVTVGATVCPGSPATLTATSATPGANLLWYDDATSGTLVNTGASYTTPVLSTTTNYWVSSIVGENYTVGKTTPVATTGNTGTGEVGLVFSATAPFTIKTVDVYPLAASVGTITVSLKNSAGTVLDSKVLDINTTQARELQRLNLNFNVPVGTSYRLVWTAKNGVTSLVRENSTSNFSYPYTVNNVCSITSAYSSSVSSAYYYYFYNWQIATGCESPREMVTATVDAAACLGTSEASAKDNLIKLYPNPFTDRLQISDVSKVKTVSILDLQGKLLRTINAPKSTIDLSELNTGMYLVVLDMIEGSKQTIKVIKK